MKKEFNHCKRCYEKIEEKQNYCSNECRLSELDEAFKIIEDVREDMRK